MTNHKKLFFIFISLTIASCATFSRTNPYPNMEIRCYGNSQAYVFPAHSSGKLIILMEGSGWDSVLGVNKKNKWQSTHMGAQFLQVLGNEYTFLILEKLNRQPGMVYSENMEDRANYYAENLIKCYNESINGYLAEHHFSSIILIGVSEGAILLPIIYEKINDKDNITAMVSMCYGGLSYYDSIELLHTTRSGFPSDWTKMHLEILNIFNPQNKVFLNSFEDDFYDLTYRWWNSFGHITPLDFYKNINIPILFIHGKTDYIVPVESTMVIQEYLPEKPFEFQYYKWAHQPESYSDTIQLRKNIAEWIRTH